MDYKDLLKLNEDGSINLYHGSRGGIEGGMEPIKFSFGWRLRHIRVKRGITQKELGLSCGFPENAADMRIRQYENDKRHPKTNIMKCLCATLQVSPLMLSLESSDLQALLFANILWADITELIHVFDSTTDFNRIDNNIYRNDTVIEANIPGIVPSDTSPLYKWLKELNNMQHKLSSEEITSKEYRDWEYLWMP